MVDKEVRAKVNVLFRQWAAAYKNTPGLERIAVLYKELPRARKPQQVKVLKETEAEVQHDRDEDHESPVSHRFSQASTSVSSSASRPSPVTLSSTTPSSTSSIFRSKDKKNKAKPFNLEKEKPQLLETIAQASVASTNLLNALQLINREHQRVSEEPEAVNRFETCKQLRRQILRYVQLIESDQWIGSLLSANDELVKALTAYEIMDKSIEDDSDSEAEGMSDIRHAARKAAAPPTNDLAGLSLHEHAPAKPPRPGNIPMPSSKQPVPDDDEEEEEDNPFGDSNAITPGMEKSGMAWYRRLLSSTLGDTNNPQERRITLQVCRCRKCIWAVGLVG